MFPFRIKLKINRHITIVPIDIHLSAAVEISHPRPNTGRFVRLITQLEILVILDIFYTSHHKLF